MLPILVFGIGALIGVNQVTEYPDSIIAWLMFIIISVFFILALQLVWKYRFDEQLKSPSKEDMVVLFQEDQILFPEGYYYKQSTVKAHIPLPASHVTEINLDTSPPSFVINDNEVIFIPCRLKNQLEIWGKKNEVPLVDRFDIWSAINDPFLDTEFDTAYYEKTTTQMIANGLSVEEVEQIRSKIKFTMETTNSIVWEWVNLSQFDYLNWTWLTKKKYWWSMEIALRNYKRTNSKELNQSM